MHWYIEVMEDGLDSRELLTEVAEARGTIKKLKADFKAYKKTAEAKIDRLKHRLKAYADMLKKQQNEVTKPLM